MRNSQKRILQDHLEKKVLSKIVLIQLWVRAKLHRCRFLLMRRSIIVIQVRSLSLSLSLPSIILIMLQTATRGWLARRQYSIIQRRLSAVVVIQSYWRATIHRRQYSRVRTAAIILQACWRGVTGRKRYCIGVERGGWRPVRQGEEWRGRGRDGRDQ